VGSYLEMQAQRGASCPYTVQLLLTAPAELKKADVLSALRERFGAVAPLEADGESLAFYHPNHRVPFKGGSAPVQCSILPVELRQGDPQLAAALSQTWAWPEGRAVASRCRAALALSDMLAAGLDRSERLDLMHGLVAAVHRLAPAQAVHWLPSQRVVKPEDLFTAVAGGDALFAAAVNVRMFRVEGRTQTLMDTVGLGAFGLPDVQCHFERCSPGRVAAVLYSVARYLYERGDVIADGHTVQGPESGERWPCRKALSWAAPRRAVVSVMPGEFAPAV